MLRHFRFPSPATRRYSPAIYFFDFLRCSRNLCLSFLSEWLVAWPAAEPCSWFSQRPASGVSCAPATAAKLPGCTRDVCFSCCCKFGREGLCCRCSAYPLGGTRPTVDSPSVMTWLLTSSSCACSSSSSSSFYFAQIFSKCATQFPFFFKNYFRRSNFFSSHRREKAESLLSDIASCLPPKPTSAAPEFNWNGIPESAHTSRAHSEPFHWQMAKFLTEFFSEF